MINISIAEYLLQNTIEMILVFGKDGKISYFNKKADELLGYEDGLDKHNIIEVFPNSITIVDDVISFKDNIEENNQLVAYRKNRTCFSTEVVINNSDNGDYICFALDNSQKDYFVKKANKLDIEAEEAAQVKTQFVANVTHELRTPVNGILGNTKELLGIEQDKDKLRLLGLIERGCNDMHSIINNILDFSKLDAGKFQLEELSFNFRDMMDYIRSTHIGKITEKGLLLNMSVSPEIPDNVIGDQLRIGQVLNNLISNAVKFTYTGKINVEVLKTAQVDNRIELFFMVIDSGIGIALEDQDKLFKSFSQVEASTTRKFGGTGLGLSICKQIVELMNGSMHVESEKGKGSIFSFHIWLEVPSEELEEAQETIQEFKIELPTLDSMSETHNTITFGTKENYEEINRKLSKLILCVDMDNWEKAEFFMEALKQLTQDAPKEIKSAMLRLKMAVQRADAEKTSIAYDALVELLPK